MSKKPDEYYWRGKGGDSWSRKENSDLRSDDRTQQQVQACLTNNADLDATDILVLVNEGEVALHGSVETPRDKILAAEIAATVPGVAEVNNLLEVRERKAS